MAKKDKAEGGKADAEAPKAEAKPKAETEAKAEAAAEAKPEADKKATRPKGPRKSGGKPDGSRRRRREEALKLVERDKKYSLAEACKLVKKVAVSKFDETVDLAVRLGVNPKHADQMVRGAVVLPHGTGQSVKILVFAKGEKAKEAEAAGADYVGAEDMVAKVQEGFMDFDRVIATPDMMGQVGKLGRILGPRGLMPNPKVGTVTFDVKTAVSEAKAGKVEYRVEKAGIVHARIGKASFSEQALQGNASALVQALIRAKPATAKGTYLRSITMSSTMGPGIRVDTLQFGGRTEEA